MDLGNVGSILKSSRSAISPSREESEGERPTAIRSVPMRNGLPKAAVLDIDFLTQAFMGKEKSQPH
jgi:hypothetical protein